MALISTGTNSEAVSHSYSHTLKLVRNDTSPELNLTLTDGTDNTAVDLTNVATLVLKVRPLGGTTVKVSVPMYRIAPYTSGAVFMQWPVAALDTAGIFTGEIELTYSDSKVQTVFDELKFEVREDY